MISSKNKSSTTKSNNILSLFGDFPREISFKRVWCPNIDDFKEYLKKNNGSSKCSISVYKQTIRDSSKRFGSAIKEGAAIDKVFIDLDGTYSFETFQILRDWLLKNDYFFRVNLSGRKAIHDKRARVLYDPEHNLGFHIYIFIEEGLKYHGLSLRNIHEYINDILIKELKNKHGVCIHKRIYKDVETKDGKIHRMLVPEDELPEKYIYSPIDRAIFGDVSRMTTPTNTYNPKRKSYCVPITKKELFLDAVSLGKLTYEQRLKLNDTLVGSKLWNVPLDIQEKDFKQIDLEDSDIEAFDINDEIINNPVFPKCIKYILSQEKPDYTARFWLMIYLREYGYSKKEVSDLLKLYMSKDMFQHLMMTERSLHYIFDEKGSQRNRMMMNCDKLRRIIGFHCVMCQECPRLKYNNSIYF